MFTKKGWLFCEYYIQIFLANLIVFVRLIWYTV